MYHIVIVRYPESELEDDVAIFNTRIPREGLEQALKCAAALAPEELDRLDRADWILREARDMVHGSYVLANSITTLEVEG